ncbi:30S ribosomal protein S6 [bacterium]|nr:30S ribosomal protein S6 [bacterium]
MSFYEINLLVSTRLSEEEAIALVAGIESKVEKYGKAISDKIVDKKKLAYPIQKETEALLVYFNFSPAEGTENRKEVLDAIEKAIKAEKNIIRHLIIRKEELKIKRERPSSRVEKNNDEETVNESKAVEETVEKDIQFNKLDELLGEEKE